MSLPRRVPIQADVTVRSRARSGLNSCGALIIGSWPVASPTTRQPGSLRARLRDAAMFIAGGDVQST